MPADSKDDKQSLASGAGKLRKKIVVEEVADQPVQQPTVEVPPETQPHIEPGKHEEVKSTLAPTQPPKSGINPLIIIIPGIFLLGALLGGIFFYQTSLNKTSQATTAPLTETNLPPKETPTSKPEEVDLSKYNINILNGSGIKGEAGKAQALLEKAGFKVSATGNASNYNYTETVIQTKSSVSESFISKLKEALGDSYKVASKTQTLADSSKEAVIVIVGTSKL